MENMVDKSFWAGKAVLLTGHTGFKGSWLALWLQTMGAKVTGYALPPPTDPSLFVAANVTNGMTSLEGDVRDFPELSKVLKKYQPEIVIHMAAQSLVRHSYNNPIETYATNVMGTVHLLEAARLTGSVRAIVNVTSDKCYENREWIWGYRENEPMGGHDPYSNSKGCAELVTAAYRNSYFNQKDIADHGVALASVRAGNVIGGGDWAADRLIPDIMRAIVQGKPAHIRNPHAIRPWQHVLEPLSGYLMLAQKLREDGAAYSEAWNFGPNDEDAKPVSWIADRLTKTWGEGASWITDGGEHPHEAHHLKLDCSKAKSRLDWHPRWHLEAALEAIVDWHRAHQGGKDMRAVTIQQIAKYNV
ncbi:MAG: CDP-glucose 4,6-dehydratase [Gallionella sp.]|nr:CDP-glucose 4,6-dehydratase [Gallionella sp.]